ncbi:MAG: DUF3800 domain-containing protein [Acidobacteriales bacterium]|nr:DUF3800 domain-containing protein [Terriglobales bacterium]
MHLVYMDDSGDPSLGIFSALAIPVESWAAAFAAVKQFRKSIYDSDGIQLYKELHAWKFVSGRGHFKKFVSVPRRCKIFEEALSTVVGISGAYLFNATFPPTTRKEGWAFERMLNRIQRNMVEKESYALIISDEGKEIRYTRIRRRLAVVNYIPSRIGKWDDGSSAKNIVIDRIVEDLVFKDSAHSYFIQLADFCAYALLRRERPLASKSAHGLDRAFAILRPILCLDANQYDAEGIIRVK